MLQNKKKNFLFSITKVYWYKIINKKIHNTHGNVEESYKSLLFLGISNFYCNYRRGASKVLLNKTEILLIIFTDKFNSGKSNGFWVYCCYDFLVLFFKCMSLNKVINIFLIHISQESNHHLFLRSLWKQNAHCTASLPTTSIIFL